MENKYLTNEEKNIINYFINTIRDIYPDQAEYLQELMDIYLYEEQTYDDNVVFECCDIVNRLKEKLDLAIKDGISYEEFEAILEDVNWNKIEELYNKLPIYYKCKVNNVKTSIQAIRHYWKQNDTKKISDEIEKIIQIL